MTKEEWEKVEKALSGVFGSAKLRVDNHDVTFQRRLYGKNRLAIVTFVDGHMKGEWLDPKKEQPEQRYLRLVAKFAWKAESRKRIKKMSKRRQKELGYDPDEKYHYFNPSWPNTTAIRRHYQKTFQSIELIEVLGC